MIKEIGGGKRKLGKKMCVRVFAESVVLLFLNCADTWCQNFDDNDL